MTSRQAVLRRATLTQADIARGIRAAQATDLTVARIVVRPDGVAVETVDPPPVQVVSGVKPLRKRINL